MIKLNIIKSTHIYRQISATVAASVLTLSGGLTFGFTAVLLPQLKTDDRFEYDETLDTWIASISPLAMVMGSLFSGTMSDMIGRKMGQIALNVPFIIGWAMIGLSSENNLMLVGRFITGICTGAIRASAMVYIGEIIDPKYRAVALFCPTIAINTGVLLSHIVGKYVYWKLSCYLFMIPNIVSFVILVFLKESPLWLLTKGKLDHGIESFRSFRGNGESSEKELVTVLKKCKEKSEETSLKDILNLTLSKPFMKSLATIFLLFVSVQFCGINSLSFYAQDIMEKTFSGDADAFLLMLATDGIRVLAGILVCFSIKLIPRKTVFVGCCWTTSLVLIAIVVYLYFHPEGFVWVGVVCMIAYIIAAVAITCIAWSFVVEILPLKIRGLGSGLSSGISFTLLFISVKITPEIMTKFGVLAMYGGFAAVTMVTGLLLIFMLPDTSGKSLQDIENDLYKKKVFVQPESNITKL